MKALVRYLTSQGAMGLLVLELLALAEVAIVPNLLAPFGAGKVTAPTGTPANDQVIPYFSSSGGPEVSSGKTDVLSDEPPATQTPPADKRACMPSSDCTPSFTVLGQYCQGGEPYTNVEVSSIGEVDLHPPEPGQWANAKPGVEPGTWIIDISNVPDVPQGFGEPGSVVISVLPSDGGTGTPDEYDYAMLTIDHASSGDLEIRLGDPAACTEVDAGQATPARRLNCRGPEAGTAYIMAAAVCECENPALAFFQVPFIACGPGERGGEPEGACPRGETLVCPRTGGPCRCAR